MVVLTHRCCFWQCSPAYVLRPLTYACVEWLSSSIMHHRHKTPSRKQSFLQHRPTAPEHCRSRIEHPFRSFPAFPSLVVVRACMCRRRYMSGAGVIRATNFFIFGIYFSRPQDVARAKPIRRRRMGVHGRNSHGCHYGPFQATQLPLPSSPSLAPGPQLV